MPNPENIRITKKVAAWLLGLSMRLIAQGTGKDYDPIDPDASFSSDSPGIIDEIPSTETDLYYWANALLIFAKAVAGILARQLTEDGTIPILAVLADQEEEI